MGSYGKRGIDSGLRVLTVAPSCSGSARVTWSPPHPHGPEPLHLQTKRMEPPCKVWGCPLNSKEFSGGGRGDRGTRPVLWIRQGRARVGKDKA